MDPGTPRWFIDALEAPRRQRFVTVDGCRISYWMWGDEGAPGAVLVHGGGAHAHWWDHIAPWLVAPGRSVVAVDLSGHGDSGHRSSYTLEDWATESLAVAEHAGLGGPPVLVGHSLGGWSTVVAAADQPDSLAGLVLIDCRIVDPDPDKPPPPPPRPLRVYDTLEEAVARYRPEPAQEGNLPYVMRHLATASLRQVEGGWTWKFDPLALYQRRPGRQALSRITCPVAIVTAEDGLVTPAILSAMCEALGDRAPVIEVPNAGHHLMLDQPLMLVTALRSVLSMWSKS